MILKKIISQDKDESRFNVNGSVHYQWISNEKIALSPEFDDLKDALEWVIKHDALR